MRQRPDVKLTLRPGAPRGGDDLVAEVVLHATTQTPVDGVDVRFTSVESVPVGKAALTHVHLVLQKKFDGLELSPGDHVLRVRFPLPDGLVPSYDDRAAFGASTSITHLVDVHVRVPWWLDRHASFAIPVRPPSVTVRGSSRVYATHPEGPRGADLGIELSLENDVVAPGGTLSGAVALVNLAARRVRAVRVDLVAVEQARDHVPYGVPREREVTRFQAVIRDDTPADGVPTPFHLRFPKDADPTFAAAFFTHVWHLEVTAEIALGRNVALRAPFQVVGDATSIAPSTHVAAPPIGHERRAKVWASVAETSELTLDAERERLHGDIGRVSVDIALERAGDTSRLVAHLGHAALGLALDAHSRGWMEVLRLGEVDLGNEAFSTRVTVRGRFEEQVRAFFDGPLRAALVVFDEVHLEDEGAALASDSGGADASALGDFVTAALRAARELDAAIARIVAPPPMALAEEAWRAFAARTSAHFSPGGMALEGARIRGEALDITTRWEGAAPVDTRIVLPLATSDDAALDAAVDRMPPEARRVIEELRSGGFVVQIGSPGVEATLHARVDDPATLEAPMERVAHLARMLSSGPRVGPYR